MAKAPSLLSFLAANLYKCYASRKGCSALASGCEKTWCFAYTTLFLPCRIGLNPLWDAPLSQQLKSSRTADGTLRARIITAGVR